MMIDRLPQVDGGAVADIDPRTAYGSPQEIEDAPGLSAAQKQQLLARWAELSKSDPRSDPALGDSAEKTQEDMAARTAPPLEPSGEK
ncbi:hypothetical protein [Breoghania sp. L-A4]|uniref:hypothetical protein n=1 Tax=Breoghania sp. L-A4 TaxID=2304600 RepID=UPI000E35FE96|nr:hypothetical protein [Breoghania sp. L-A4]AXS40205.1 hypothetical protein D1F64_09225 [Breoghania sp. L-A4]